MSASREKKQRQNDPNQGLSQKQRKELEEQKAAKHKAILYTAIGIVVAALVVVLLVWHSGFFQSRTTAVSVGGRDYSPADVEYYYRSLVQYEYYQTYAFDPQSDLRTQYVDANQTQSYHDKFLQTTLETLTEVAAVENAAEAEGFTLTQEELDHVAASVNTMKENASSNGYTYATYLKAVFGPYMTPSRYETCMKRAALVNSYTTKISDSFAVSDEEIQTYYEAHAAELDSYDYRYLFISGTAPSGTDSEGNTVEATEEEKAAALAAAKVKADELVSKVSAADDRSAAFAELAPDYVAESSRASYESDPDYSLRTGTSGSSLSSYSTYGSWLTDADRKAGDVEVIEGSGGYYVVLFLDRYLDETPTADIRHILIKAELTQEDDAATSDVDESAVPTQEALDAAKAEAEDLLAQWESGERTAESFGALAEAHSDDTGSNTNGGLYEAVYDGQMFAGFNDWIFNDEHTQGDTGLIENTQSGQQGWHVIYFQSWNDPKWTISVRNTLLNDQLTAWVNGLTEGLEVVEGSGLSYVG